MGREFAQLRSQLVPENGPPTSLQGLLVAAVDRVMRECCGNNCVDWVDSHRADLQVIQTILASHEEDVSEDLRAIRAWAEGGEPSQDLEESVDHLLSVSIAWCGAHPDPLPVDDRRRSAER